MTMNLSLRKLPYSFSMINLVKLLPVWSWKGFDQVMAQAGTKRVELVPSMMLGVDWDQQINDQTGTVQQALERLLEHYKVESIQSLTYGLPINLAEPLIDHPKMRIRLDALAELGKATSCSVLILGSPGQKKIHNDVMTLAEHKQRFIENCSWIARKLGPEMTLSLEHNTIAQGAEYCNTFGDITEIVKTLRTRGLTNVGINLDTKCIIDEFGKDVRVDMLLAETSVKESISSIQISHDFLTRNTLHRDEDKRNLSAFAQTRNICPSLEEFGLEYDQLKAFIEAWTS